MARQKVTRIAVVLSSIGARCRTEVRSEPVSCCFCVHYARIVRFAGFPPQPIHLNIALQRFVDRYAGVPLCALVSVFDRWIVQPLRGRRAHTKRDRILVILLSEMGSLVLAQPMFAALRTRYPQASLHVMLFAKNREVLDLLGALPPENVIIVDDKSLVPFVRSIIGAILTVRRLDIDVVIDCELFARVSSLLSYLSGAALRVGSTTHSVNPPASDYPKIERPATNPAASCEPIR